MLVQFYEPQRGLMLQGLHQGSLQRLPEHLRNLRSLSSCATEKSNSGPLWHRGLHVGLEREVQKESGSEFMSKAMPRERERERERRRERERSKHTGRTQREG